MFLFVSHLPSFVHSLEPFSGGTFGDVPGSTQETLSVRGVLHLQLFPSILDIVKGRTGVEEEVATHVHRDGNKLIRQYSVV